MTRPSHHRALRGGAAAVVGLRYPRERFRLDVARCAARAADAHQEVAETIVQPFDVRQHAHGAHVRSRRREDLPLAFRHRKSQRKNHCGGGFGVLARFYELG